MEMPNGAEAYPMRPVLRVFGPLVRLDRRRPGVQGARWGYKGAICCRLRHPLRFV